MHFPSPQVPDCKVGLHNDDLPETTWGRGGGGGCAAVYRFVRGKCRSVGHYGQHLANDKMLRPDFSK